MMTALTVRVRPTLELNDEQFAQICGQNPDLRFELTAKGELIVMSPTGSETGGRNSTLSGQLWVWNQRSRSGKTFDSSTGFCLPNGAKRSPDASWVRRERWESLTPEERRKFAPICPDFVVELLSPTDELEITRAKMQEYMENGALLGWLIDPNNRRVEIYRCDRDVEIRENPTTVSGEEVLPGFVLELSDIFTG
ncbi:Uma2 family endonuclease [Spirulina sp. 06S082]|nr:Uma2 family endonuclease [Spirulina sp. 06S082]MEA5469636.1 Uma2 family endonuclease [Spirulina sp. 06S082]